MQDDVNDFIRGMKPPPKEVLELDFVYEALAHPRRRYIVYSLLTDTRWTLEELATKLVAWEQDVPEEYVAPVDRDGMYVSMLHTHIPKLADLDIVEYERGGREVIVPAENAVQVLAVLEGAGASLDNAQETHARSDYDTE